MDKKKFEQAAAAAGIAAQYINAKGEQEEISPDIRQRLLAAMSTNRSKPGPIPPCKVFLRKRTMTLEIGGKGSYQWQLTSEKGRDYQGEINAGEALTLPSSLAYGYHTLSLRQGKKSWPCRIIIAPKRCYEPEPLRQGEKLWGACVQLYTLRSEQNWGIGDFGDLKQMLTEIAERGGSFIGLNPVHSLYPASPANASPYSPSSRRWLNVLYIDVNAVPEFQESKEGQRWLRGKAIQSRLQQAREAEWVDYDTVGELKMTALRYAWQRFSQRQQDDASQAHFTAFIEKGGESLYWQAAFDALHGAMRRENKDAWGWPVWPENLREAHGEAVQQFCRERLRDAKGLHQAQGNINIRF